MLQQTDSRPLSSSTSIYCGMFRAWPQRGRLVRSIESRAAVLDSLRTLLMQASRLPIVFSILYRTTRCNRTTDLLRPASSESVRDGPVPLLREHLKPLSCSNSCPCVSCYGCISARKASLEAPRSYILISWSQVGALPNSFLKAGKWNSESPNALPLDVPGARFRMRSCSQASLHRKSGKNAAGAKCGESTHPFLRIKSETRAFGGILLENRPPET